MLKTEITKDNLVWNDTYGLFHLSEKYTLKQKQYIFYLQFEVN